MKERPILFQSAMVNAILAGRKTQTRRICKLPAAPNHLGEWMPSVAGGPGCRDKHGKEVKEIPIIYHTRTGQAFACPFGEVGDRLWVRETTKQRYLPNILTGEPTNALCGQYCADDESVLDEAGFDFSWWYSRPVCPSIHMPRWASRITLEITGVRVERLQDISEDDVDAEGIFDKGGIHLARCPWAGGSYNPDTHPCKCGDNSPQEEFHKLWDKINGKKYPWDSNPFVWIIEFKRAQQ